MALSLYGTFSPDTAKIRFYISEDQSVLYLDSREMNARWHFPDLRLCSEKHFMLIIKNYLSLPSLSLICLEMATRQMTVYKDFQNLSHTSYSIVGF